MARRGVVRVTPVAAPVRPAPPPTTTAPRSSAPAWLPSTRPVGNSSDLERILALPRRPAFDEHRDSRAQVDAYTTEFRRPGGKMTLRPSQAFCLDEARRVGGLVALLGVGTGKTLLGLTLPLALGVKRAVLLMPPQLKTQLLERNYPDLSEHWRLPNVVGAGLVYPDTDAVIYPIAYSELSSLTKADVLERIQPEAIIADEAHNLRRLESARTKRFLRYVLAASKAGSLKSLCLMSGTLAQDSIEDLRFVCYALGKYAPVPWDVGTLRAWADALDPVDRPSPPGELVRLCAPGESPRSGFRRRLVETPGVVATTTSPLAVKLVYRERPLETPKTVRDVLAEMHRTWTTPWGEEIEDALTFSRYARQIAAGLLYRRTWPRNEPLAVRQEWLEARAEWFREVRAYLTRPAAVTGRSVLDSPKALELAATDGRRPSRNFDRWSAVRNEAEPDQVAVWVDDFLVRDAIAWGREHRGVIWYEHDALGRRIAAEGGYALIDGGASGEAVLGALDAARRAGREHPTVVASRPARGTGTDGLQYHFWEQLITTTSSNGARTEQLLGRLHRLGTEARTITTWVYRHTPEMAAALDNARREAAFLLETTGNEQKLCVAEFEFESNVEKRTTKRAARSRKASGS